MTQLEHYCSSCHLLKESMTYTTPRGKKQQALKDQNSNKFCSCAAYMHRRDMPLAPFPQEKWRYITASSSLCQIIYKIIGKKPLRSSDSKNWSRRHSTCTLLKSRNQVCLKTDICINLGGFGNRSYACTAFWKSLVYTIVSHGTELQNPGSQESIYWNFSRQQVTSLDSIFKRGIS